ncbi:hypothetical protein ACHAXA_006466 [Cyclostephanos tholiformis]|uniref:FAS1 domain-containing protein n=1 Tax=Cyclostephanos tholiformis TaxID=382380 RepID=A0ABD3R3L1_9STRA
MIRCSSFSYRTNVRYTAPTNNAFSTLSAETLEYLLQPENIGCLRNTLLYHVLDGSYLSSDLPSGSVLTLRSTSSSSPGMGGGEDEDDILLIDAMSTTGIVTLDGRANVIISDAFRARNGVVHAIDHVLLPDDVAALVTNNNFAGGDGGDDFLSVDVLEEDSSSTNSTDDFFDVLLSPDDDQNDFDDGGSLHDDVDDASGEDEFLTGDDCFDGFLDLDSFVADNFTDDTFPTRDDWYEDNDMLTGNTDDKPVESSDGRCFSDITCCFFFICR